MVLWRDGEVSLGPVVTRSGPAEPDRPPSSEWAFNQALRQFGAERGDAFDEFDALGLGRRRRTEDWAASGPG